MKTFDSTAFTHPHTARKKPWSSAASSSRKSFLASRQTPACTGHLAARRSQMPAHWPTLFLPRNLCLLCRVETVARPSELSTRENFQWRLPKPASGARLQTAKSCSSIRQTLGRTICYEMIYLLFIYQNLMTFRIRERILHHRRIGDHL